MKNIKVKTKSGYKIEVNPRILDSWDVLEIMASVDSENASEKLKGTINLVNMLFRDKKDDYMNYLKEHDADGLADTDVIREDVLGIIEEVKALKNSSPSEQ